MASCATSIAARRSVTLGVQARIAVSAAAAPAGAPGQMALSWAVVSVMPRQNCVAFRVDVTVRLKPEPTAWPTDLPLRLGSRCVGNARQQP